MEEEQTGFVQYAPEPGKPPWRVECWNAFSKQFQVTQADLPKFHAAAYHNQPGWKYLCLLYGCVPVVPPINTDVKFLQSWTIEEIASYFKTKRQDIQADIEVIKEIWLARKSKAAAAPTVAPKAKAAPAPPSPVKEPKSEASKPTTQPVAALAPAQPIAAPIDT